MVDHPGPVPGSDEHLDWMTASKVAAVVGESPYESPRSLFHLMTRQVVADPVTPEQTRGHWFELPTAEMWCHQNGYQIIISQPWAVHDSLPWAGAHADFIVIPKTGTGARVLEVKTDQSLAEWGEPGTDQIPPHYMVQVQWQMACGMADQITVLHLGPRMVLDTYVVDRDDVIITALEDAAEGFMERIRSGGPPPVDDHPRTERVLRRLHPDIEPDGTVMVPKRLAQRAGAARRAVEAAESRLRLAKSQLLERMGTAKHAVTRDHTPVAVRQRGPNNTIRLLIEKENRHD